MAKNAFGLLTDEIRLIRISSLMAHEWLAQMVTIICFMGRYLSANKLPQALP